MPQKSPHHTVSEARWLPPSVLRRVFLRTYVAGAAYNIRGIQNVGMAHVMAPGLAALFPDAEQQRHALMRYARHFSTHLLWAPLLAGVLLHLEARIAGGQMPESAMDSARSTTAYTLSAIGDSVFGGSLLVFWALGGACLAATGQFAGLVCWVAGWFAALQAFKVLTFRAGLCEGLSVLTRLKRWDLINWGARLKGLNAVLLVFFLYAAWPGQPAWHGWMAGMAALAGAAWLVFRTLVPREVVAAAMLAGMAALPLL